MSTSTGKIPRPPEHMMRYMLHHRAKSYCYFALASSLASGLVYFYCYVIPIRNQYREYERKYDPYEEMRRICSYPKKYMVSCPDVLYEKLKEKGITIGDDPFAPKVEEVQATDVNKEMENSVSVESFSSG